MGSETADIDIVLKESEALLDRLHSNSSNSVLNDLCDGGASLSSLGSLRLMDAGSMATDSTVWDVRSRVADTIGKGDFSSQLPANSPEIRSSATGAEPLRASQPRPPPQWEKVSSASAGDDDYVPIVDYTKENSRKKVATIRASKSRLSRLEAYRGNARKKQRRRRVVAFVIFVLLAIIFGVWAKRMHLSTDEEPCLEISNTIYGSTNETKIGSAGSEDKVALSSLSPETDSTRSEGPDAETCPATAKADFFEAVKESYYVKTKNELLSTERENEIYETVSSTEIEKKIYGKASSTDTENEIHERSTGKERVLSVSISPSKSEGQSQDVPNCKNPLTRLLSRKCRKMVRQRQNLLVEVAVYL